MVLSPKVPRKSFNITKDNKICSSIKLESKKTKLASTYLEILNISFFDHFLLLQNAR